MNELRLITCAVHFVKQGDMIEYMSYVRFLDSDNNANFNTFLTSLKNVKKFRILAVEWESEPIDFEDSDYDCSNTIH